MTECENCTFCIPYGPKNCCKFTLQKLKVFEFLVMPLVWVGRKGLSRCYISGPAPLGLSSAQILTLIRIQCFRAAQKHMRNGRHMKETTTGVRMRGKQRVRDRFSDGLDDAPHHPHQSQEDVTAGAISPRPGNDLGEQLSEMMYHFFWMKTITLIPSDFHEACHSGSQA